CFHCGGEHPQLHCGSDRAQNSFSSTLLADGSTAGFDQNDFGNCRIALSCGYQRNQSCLQGGKARIVRSVLDVRPFICAPKSSSDCYSRISVRIRPVCVTGGWLGGQEW